MKLLPLQFSNKHWNIPISYKWRRAEMDQEELNSAKTEFIKEDSENMSDPEPCRMKHTEDPDEQRGWCLFFIHDAGEY